METVLAFVIGALFASGMYSMLRRSLVKLIIGLIFLGTAGNLLIFVSGGLTPGLPPLIQSEEPVHAGNGGHSEKTHHSAEREHEKGEAVLKCADPLPQAMILTAIVIGFGVLAFTLVLVKRTYKTVGTDDIDDLNLTS